jgi:hypothetical protein
VVFETIGISMPSLIAVICELLENLHLHRLFQSTLKNEFDRLLSPSKAARAQPSRMDSWLFTQMAVLSLPPCDRKRDDARSLLRHIWLTRQFAESP